MWLVLDGCVPPSTVRVLDFQMDVLELKSVLDVNFAQNGLLTVVFSLTYLRSGLKASVYVWEKLFR